MRRLITGKKGFAAAELITLLLVLGVAAFVVSGLMNQVLKVGQRSAQTGAILEIRNKVNSITKNPDTWLEKMRAKHSVYAGCIPDANAATTALNVFNCPTSSQSYRDDALLAKAAGESLKIASAPIVDIMGDPLAGTLQEPLYLDLNGRVCDGAEAKTKCSLKSTGYFMRSEESGNPGDVRFVVKVEKNLLSLGTSNTGVIRPEYLSIEIGRSWMQSTPKPSDSIKLGYLLDGEAMYVKPGLSCGATGVLTGINAAGEAVCKNVPTGCSDGEAVLDAQSSELVCSSSNNCGEGQVYLGHFAGTGEAICSAANMSCPANEVQVGVKGNPLVADCKVLPSCADSQVLSYDGSQFQCAADLLAKTCPSGQSMVGINADGSLKCQVVHRDLASDNLTCPDGQVMYGTHPNGSVKCRDIYPKGMTAGHCVMGWGGYHAYGTPIWPAKRLGGNSNTSYPNTCSCEEGWVVVRTGTCAHGDCKLLKAPHGSSDEYYYHACIKL